MGTPGSSDFAFVGLAFNSSAAKQLLPLQKRFPSLYGTSWGHSCCSAYPNSGSVQNPWKHLFLARYLVF